MNEELNGILVLNLRERVMVAGFTTARPVTDELIHDVLTRQLVKHNETDIPVSDVLGIVCVILGDNFHAVIEPEVENVWPTFSN